LNPKNISGAIVEGVYICVQNYKFRRPQIFSETFLYWIENINPGQMVIIEKGKLSYIGKIINEENKIINLIHTDEINRCFRFVKGLVK
jgi:hypothetical protein